MNATLWIPAVRFCKKNDIQVISAYAAIISLNDGKIQHPIEAHYAGRVEEFLDEISDHENEIESDNSTLLQRRFITDLQARELLRFYAKTENKYWANYVLKKRSLSGDIERTTLSTKGIWRRRRVQQDSKTENGLIDENDSRLKFTIDSESDELDDFEFPSQPQTRRLYSQEMEPPSGEE